MKPLISVVVNTVNEAQGLRRCLQSVKDFADEIVVVDMESQDDSAKIAKEFGAQVYTHKFVNYVEPARNFAIKKAKGRWVLILDPDERLSRPLAKRLKKIARDKKEIDVVLIPRKNLIMGKWMQNSRWWPDYLPRFFKKGKVDWPKQIHQQPKLEGMIETLPDISDLAIIHYNYESLDEFLTRGARYAEVQSKELLEEKNYQLSSQDLLLKPLEEFLGRFFVGEAYKDGFHGLAISLLQAWVVLLTYLKVWEKQKYPEKTLEASRVKTMMAEFIYQLEFWRSHFLSRMASSPLDSLKKPLLKIRLWLARL
ncbi:MAG: glycosyltransferase family 2 protein [Patescibacteria group bacterium]